EVVEHDLVAPRGIVEALVTLGGFGDRLGRLAHHALRPDPPQLHGLAPHVPLRLHEPVAVGPPPGGAVRGGLGELERIDRLRSLGLVTLGELGQQLLAALRDVLEGRLHLLGFGGRKARSDLGGRAVRHVFPLSNQWLCAICCDTFDCVKQYLVPLLGKLRYHRGQTTKVTMRMSLAVGVTALILLSGCDWLGIGSSTPTSSEKARPGAERQIGVTNSLPASRASGYDSSFAPVDETRNAPKIG